MARPRALPASYEAPSKEERAEGMVVVCDGCERAWPRRLVILRLRKCVNCARSWWREARAAHRSGSAGPPLHVPKSSATAPAGLDVDAFLAKLTAPKPERRAPRPPEQQYDPNESIDSIVSRMGGDVIDVPLLPAPRKR